MDASASLSGLSNEDIINVLQKDAFVSHIHITITLGTLVNNLVFLDFDAHNPLTMEVAIDRVVSMAGLNGTVWVSFDQEFAQPVVVSPLSTANSGIFGNVLLTQGAIPSLDIIPIGVLDLISTDVYLRAGTTNGSLGVPIQIKGLKQNTVPTSWDLALG